MSFFSLDLDTRVIRKPTHYHDTPIIDDLEEHTGISAQEKEAQDAIKAFKARESQEDFSPVTISDYFQSHIKQIVREKELVLNMHEKVPISQLKEEMQSMEARLNNQFNWELYDQYEYIAQTLERRGIYEQEKVKFKEAEDFNSSFTEITTAIDAAEAEIQRLEQLQDTENQRRNNQISDQIRRIGAIGNQNNNVRTTLSSLNDFVQSQHNARNEINRQWSIIRKKHGESIQHFAKSMNSIRELTRFANQLGRINDANYLMTGNYESESVITSKRKFSDELLKFYKYPEFLINNDATRTNYLVTNLNFKLVDKMKERFPKLFVTWYELIVEDNVLQVTKEEAESQIIQNEARIRDALWNSINRNRDRRRIRLIPDIRMLHRSNVLRENAVFLNDGLKLEWYDALSDVITLKSRITKFSSLLKIGFEIDILDHYINKDFIYEKENSVSIPTGNDN